MGNVQTFINTIAWWCENGDLGYDQWNRWDIREGGECDCSSLVIQCARWAGFETGGATYTGNMRSAFTANGWVALPNDGNPYPGDILLNDANHVAVYLGGGRLAQASIDERGEIAGGQSGDQIDYETNTRSYYNYPWSCYLRYVGGETESTGWIPADDPYNPNGYGETYVATIQTLLAQNGYSVGSDGADGILGEKTFEAIKKFQADHGLEADGIPGPNTVSVLHGNKASGPKPMEKNETDGQVTLEVDGIPGPATIARFQQVMGTEIDGVLDEDGSPAVKAFQHFLNSYVPSGSIRDLNGDDAVELDGILGPKTWRIFQYWAWCNHKDIVDQFAASWEFAEFVDGEDGVVTWKVFQTLLNISYAYSERIA